MRAAASEGGKLFRKQILVSTRQIAKLSSLAKSEGKSEAEIVRLAIDAFEPTGVEGMNAPDLMDLVSSRLKETIRSTKHANKVVSKTLEQLNAE